MDHYYSGYGYELWDEVNNLVSMNQITSEVQHRTLNKLQANVFYVMYLNNDNQLELKARE